MKRRHFLQAGLVLASANAMAQTKTIKALPLKIGALVPLTGAGGAYGAAMRNALLLAADEVNHAGGINGRMIEITTADCQTNPARAELEAWRMIEQDKVSAIVGTWASSVTLAVMKVTDAANVIEMNVSGAPAISFEDKKDLVWRFHPSQVRFGEACAVALFQLKALRPAYMAINNATGLASLDGFKKAWQQSGGTLVTEIMYEPGKASYDQEVAQLLKAKPNVVVMGSFAPDMTAIFKDYLKVKSPAPLSWVAPAWAANEDFLKAVGKDAAEGVITVSSASNEGSPAYVRFVKNYEKQYSKLDLSNIYAPMCFDMVQILAMAALRAGNSTTSFEISGLIRSITNKPGMVVDGFKSAKAPLAVGNKVDYDGASGRLGFDHFGDTITPFEIRKYVAGAQVRQRIVKIDA